MAKRKKIYSSPFEAEWAVLNHKAFLPHQRVTTEGKRMTYQEARKMVIAAQSEVVRLNDRLCNMHSHWTDSGLCDSVVSLIKQHEAAVEKWNEAKFVMNSLSPQQ
ncbi:TPA: hypothetical protein QHD00_002242 [Enterobacter cloacae subsp. cloacae]|nr:hypothetical protein [Enterobacter cloacae subsp. cloacae]HDT6093711.1 hypothetical protein [Enterobacter cloacae subsp. cloacae]